MSVTKTGSHQCGSCDASFFTEQGLRVHTYRMHTPKGKKHSTKVKAARRKFNKAKLKRGKHTEVSTLSTPAHSMNYCPHCGANISGVVHAMS